MFTHLANLFFEQSKVIDEDEEGAILATLTVDRVPDGSLIGKARLMWNGEVYSAEFSETVDDGDEKTKNRQLKRIYSHIFLEALEQATGMQQSWGILTGIRPMKLYHKYRQQGYSKENAIELLMERHRISREKSELLAKIADVQLRTVPDLYDLKKEVSIYIGIPFCPTKCAYCTFPAYAINRKNGRVESFLDGLHEEIREMGKWLTGT